MDRGTDLGRGGDDADAVLGLALCFVLFRAPVLGVRETGGLCEASSNVPKYEV